MTPRERIVTALDFKKTDRIPRYEIFFPDFIDSWRKTVVEDARPDIYEHYSRIDIGGVLATQEGPFLNKTYEEELGGGKYLVRDSWGRLKRGSHNGMLFEVLETAVSARDALDSVVFEDPNGLARYEEIARGEQEIQGRFAPVCGTMGLFMPSYYLRGEFNFFIDLMEDEVFCRALVEKVAAFITEVGRNALEKTNTWDTAIWVYDELANAASPLISPDTFERIFLPSYRHMISKWRALGAQHVILHCDGNCTPLLDMLIDAGFTGIQGAYSSTGMNLPALKSKYGNRLAFVGGMCNTRVLAQGTRREIETQAHAIAECGRDGGVIIGAHSIDADIPVENYDYYYETLNRLDAAW